nr:hypothetical protein [Sicyoidochytrium minutum DNA virus]
MCDFFRIQSRGFSQNSEIPRLYPVKRGVFLKGRIFIFDIVFFLEKFRGKFSKFGSM